EADDRALLAAHAIDLVVAKNSGGTPTHRKIAAARAPGPPPIFLRPPALPQGPTRPTTQDPPAWLPPSPPRPAASTRRAGPGPGRGTGRVWAEPTMTTVAMSALAGSAACSVVTATVSSALPTARPKTVGVVAGR